MAFLALLPFFIGGCSMDLPDDDAVTEGGLVLSMPGIDVQIHETRTTPEMLDKPDAEAFHLHIQRMSNDVTIYDGAFTSNKITAAPDDYTITATYGDNPVLGLDRPYYIGTTTATVVSTTEPTAVTLPVAVGNALVSVTFGTDDTEAARFDRFYSDYGVQVSVGNNQITLTPDIANKSVYVRAGSKVDLSFTGYLIAAGRQVSMPVTLPPSISNTLSAADHLILTLSLEPNAESAVVTVVKAEMEKVSVEEKVPYNWLPRPVVTAEHKFVQGELVGTDLNIAASFPDVRWEATIHQGTATGNIVRRLSGTGALTSTYQLNPAWPYLPPGNYVATYRYYSKQGRAYNFSKTTEFSIPAPALTLIADAYSAHSKYEEGDIGAANACERLTVYAPQASLNVAATLFSNANYTKSYSYSIGSQSFTVDATRNIQVFDNITDVPISSSLYNFQVVADFCGQTVTATKPIRITGLPYSLNLASHGEWSASNGVDWFENDVRLGNLSTGGQNITTNSSVIIPQGTKYCADYDVNVHSATVGTTFTITAGTQEILSIREDGALFNNSDNLHSGTTNTFTANSEITSIRCNNSYGAGQTCTHIYALTFKYGQ